MSSIVNILPALAFLLILLSISAYIQRNVKRKQGKRISPRITSSAAVLSAALCWL